MFSCHYVCIVYVCMYVFSFLQFNSLGQKMSGMQVVKHNIYMLYISQYICIIIYTVYNILAAWFWLLNDLPPWVHPTSVLFLNKKQHKCYKMIRSSYKDAHL